MELYIISKDDLSIKSVCEPCSYSLNLDEETNGVSEFVLPELNNAKKGYYLYASGLSKPFVFLIDDVLGGKNEQTVQVTALDISNIFDRKIIEANTDVMTSDGIEDFIADCILNNFVNSNDPYINVGYIEIYIHSHTKRIEQTNAEDGLFNLHTFITNCRQNKNIFCDFTIDTKNQKLKIDIENKTLDTVLIDTTLEEVTDYNKIYDVDVCSKVTVFIREDNSTYDLYLLSDRTTTTNKNNPNRVNGRVEVISVDTADKAPEEALNVMKGNTYKHLVEFSIAKTSKLVDVSSLNIGTPIKIKTEDDIYDSYISAISINDTDNFVSFKSGSLRVTLIDKMKQKTNGGGNKLDVSGGKIVGNLNVEGVCQVNGINIEEMITNIYSTSEINTGIKWIDNKDIYRKVIQISNYFSTTLVTINTGITNADTVVKIDGEFSRSGYTRKYSIDNMYMNEWTFDTADGTLYIHTNNEFVSLKGHIIIEYTKNN